MQEDMSQNKVANVTQLLGHLANRKWGYNISNKFIVRTTCTCMLSANGEVLEILFLNISSVRNYHTCISQCIARNFEVEIMVHSATN